MIPAGAGRISDGLDPAAAPAHPLRTMDSPRIQHLWRPYTQMKGAAPPLEAVRTHGSRIVLADGRELIDGIASWWTAAHGYNHPHIRAAVAAQLEAMPHVMFGGLTHAPTSTTSSSRIPARSPSRSP
jgi:adenosylmethionine-8-amino-7-oxononanoate aminotransferase